VLVIKKITNHILVNMVCDFFVKIFKIMLIFGKIDLVP